MMRITRERKRKSVDENLLSMKNILEIQDVKELMKWLEETFSFFFLEIEAEEKLGNR